MNDEEFEKAHDLYELFFQLIVTTGTTLLKDVAPTQRDYVLTKLGDEFRFWNIEEVIQVREKIKNGGKL